MAKAGTKPTRKPRGKTKRTDKEQSDRFIETARALGVDEDGRKFESDLQKIVRIQSPRKGSKP
jgi:hypothetical protein